jgi:hypothetical protein
MAPKRESSALFLELEFAIFAGASSIKDSAHRRFTLFRLSQSYPGRIGIHTQRKSPAKTPANRWTSVSG